MVQQPPPLLARKFHLQARADERGHVSSEGMSGFFKQAWQSVTGGQDEANGAVVATPPEPAAIDPAAKPDANGDLAAQPKAEVAPPAAAVPDLPRAEQGVADETAIKSDGKPDSPDEIEGDRAPDTVNGGSGDGDDESPPPNPHSGVSSSGERERERSGSPRVDQTETEPRIGRHEEPKDNRNRHE